MEEYFKALREKVEPEIATDSQHEIIISTAFMHAYECAGAVVKVERGIRQWPLKEQMQVEEEKVIQIPRPEKLIRAARRVVPFQRDTGWAANLTTQAP